MSDMSLFKPASRDIAEEAAATLIGFWPNAKANEYYRDALAKVFERYPAESVGKAIDPVNGLSSEFESLPKLATVKRWLERELELLKKREKARAQLADRPRVTCRNFFDQALAYGQAKWSANKQPWPTVAPGEPAWDWWRDYFSRLDWFPHTWKMIEAGETKEQRFTVPELDPHIFDSRSGVAHA